MKNMILFLLLLASQLAGAQTRHHYYPGYRQVKPLVINIDTISDATFPLLYYIGDCYFRFQSAKTIVDVKGRLATQTPYNDNRGVVIDKDTAGVYVISIAHDKQQPLPDGNTAILSFYFADEAQPKNLQIKVALIPKVRVLLLDSLGNELPINKSPVKYKGMLYARACWDNPAYLKASGRFRGHTHTTLKGCDELAHGLDTWNDTGDNSRRFDISVCPGAVLAIIEHRRVTTFALSSLGDRGGHTAEISDDMPKEILFVGGE